MPLKYKLIVIATLSTLMTGVVAMEKNQKNSDNILTNLRTSHCHFSERGVVPADNRNTARLGLQNREPKSFV